MSHDNSDSVRALYDGGLSFVTLHSLSNVRTKRYEKTELVIVKYPEKVEPKGRSTEAFLGKRNQAHKIYLGD